MWQDISTATKIPYEEVLVLVKTYDGDAFTHRIAMWDPENDDWTVFMTNWDPEPVFWMPLPPPPSPVTDATAIISADESKND